MVMFGMGASFMALFARVGGGIFTKAADVGADLVGKVEAGIPEDDPRNPATIADNVGDNVGDVAGMGADLYESYVGSILATFALGVAAYPEKSWQSMLLPIALAVVGILCSIFGSFLIRTKEGASQRELLGTLRKGTYTAAVLAAILACAALSGAVPSATLPSITLRIHISPLRAWPLPPRPAPPPPSSAASPSACCPPSPPFSLWARALSSPSWPPAAL